MAKYCTCIYTGRVVSVERDVRIRLVFCCLTTRTRTFKYYYCRFRLHIWFVRLCANVCMPVAHTHTSAKKRCKTKPTRMIFVYAGDEYIYNRTNISNTQTHSHSPVQIYINVSCRFGLTMLHSTRTISFAVRTWSGHIHVTCSVLFIVVPPNNLLLSKLQQHSTDWIQRKIIIKYRRIQQRKNRKLYAGYFHLIIFN